MIEVVIPAFNAAPFIRETLYSVAAQSLRPDLVSVIDDRSTDDTVRMVEECAGELRDRITISLARNSGPQGPAAARNLAIARSKADCIALLDSDDVLAPTHHHDLVRGIEAVPDAVLSFGDSTTFDERGTIVRRHLASSGTYDLPAEEMAPGCFVPKGGMFTAMLRSGRFGTSSCLFKRRAAIEAGLFDEEMVYCEDTDLFLRLSLLGRFVFTRHIVSHKRVHGSNLSHPRNKVKFARGTARTLAKLAASADRIGLSAAQHEALQRELARALEGYMWSAARAGVGAYWEAALLAGRNGWFGIPLKPRYLGGLVFGPLLRQVG